VFPPVLAPVAVLPTVEVRRPIAAPEVPACTIRIELVSSLSDEIPR